MFAHPEHLDEFGSLLKGKDLANYTEKRKAFEKAVRQFNVLWTDDFGSLWQVIRLDFNINNTMKDVKEWWKEVNDDEEENEDSDE